MKVLFQRCHAKAIIPSYANPGDAGLDISAAESVTIAPGRREMVRTGLKMQLPAGYEAQIRPRSGLAVKNGITLLNTPGTIDEGYRGEICVIVINHGEDEFLIEPGMRIAQMVIAPVARAEPEEVVELRASVRDTNGFGSSGV
jgi:dUTP pyrophosphatase